jgi:hypothetical protein
MLALLNVYPVKSKNISPGRSVFNWGVSLFHWGLTPSLSNTQLKGTKCSERVVNFFFFVFSKFSHFRDNLFSVFSLLSPIYCLPCPAVASRPP